jgi:hypothetical protein
VEVYAGGDGGAYEWVEEGVSIMLLSVCKDLEVPNEFNPFRVEVVFATFTSGFHPGLFKLKPFRLLLTLELFIERV